MKTEMQVTPAVWFPTIQANTGADVFTRRLVDGLRNQGIKAEITWLPLRAEYAPWTVPIPKPPEWATVVHVNTWLPPRFIPGNLPLVATLHHAIHHPDAQSYKGWLKAAYHKYWIAHIERRIMGQADKVIAVSQFAADSARSTLIDTQIHVIYNGVDIRVFKPSHENRSSARPFKLLYVGSWKPLKGVGLLTTIMRELGEGFELRYTGGPKANINKKHMPSNMIDIGRLPSDSAVADAMKSADAFLFLSKSEGFGLVAAEAMACGLPVVASRIGPLSELIEHGKTGILCQPDNVTEFVTAVKDLSTDQVLHAAMCRAAPKRAQEDFSETAMIEGYLNIYRDITSASFGLSP